MGEIIWKVIDGFENYEVSNTGLVRVLGHASKYVKKRYEGQYPKILKPRYDEDGYLIISETDSCPLWEKDTIPSAFVCTKDCFYCAFSNFRQDEYMQSLGDKEKGEKLYSICHNEVNRK